MRFFSMKNNFNILITIIGVLLIIVIFSFHKNRPLSEKINALRLNENSIYLIQRGTTGKLGDLAKDFNISNKYASHLGIGFIKNNDLVIYHVYVDKNKNNSNLYIETINEFTKPIDLNYLAIWRLNNINLKTLESIRHTFICSEKEKINFDFTFNENNKSYYCSEYIVRELEKNDIKIMHHHRKRITGMIQQMLKRDTLTYFPVDGFENTNTATKVFEWIK